MENLMSSIQTRLSEIIDGWVMFYDAFICWCVTVNAPMWMIRRLYNRRDDIYFWCYDYVWFWSWLQVYSTTVSSINTYPPEAR